MTTKNLISTLDETTFKNLFNEYFIPLTHFAQRFVHDTDTAKEIVHTVFINLWEKRDSLDLQKSVKSYLFTSTNNRCLNYIRDHKKFDKDEPGIDYLENRLGEQDSDILVEKELGERIEKAVASLPEKCRRVFEMSRFEDLKYSEIAEKLQVSVKAVEAQMTKALKLLRDELKDYMITGFIVVFAIYLKNFLGYVFASVL